MYPTLISAIFFTLSTTKPLFLSVFRYLALRGDYITYGPRTQGWKMKRPRKKPRALISFD